MSFRRSKKSQIEASLLVLTVNKVLVESGWIQDEEALSVVIKCERSPAAVAIARNLKDADILRSNPPASSGTALRIIEAMTLKHAQSTLYERKVCVNHHSLNCCQI